MDNILLIENLRMYGADIDGIKNRLMDDAAFYKECFDCFLEDENFAALGAALESGNYPEAFNTSHALKGLTANMGLTPIHKLVCELVESLRAHDYSNVNAQYAAMLDNFNVLKKFA